MSGATPVSIRQTIGAPFGAINIHAIPTVEKVVVHVGIGKFAKETARVARAQETLARITGQTPVPTKAKKSISNFKVRKGMVIGYKVTLRRARMWDFIGKLTRLTLPRMRDFRGLSLDTVDANGNLSIGFSDQLPFPESTPDDIEVSHGVQVTLVTNARRRDRALAVYKALGFPFRI